MIKCKSIIIIITTIIIIIIIIIIIYNMFSFAYETLEKQTWIY